MAQADPVIAEQIAPAVLIERAQACVDAVARLEAEIADAMSEIRNWIATAGAVEHLDVAWQEYVPCYRSPAGTGCGMGFAAWR